MNRLALIALGLLAIFLSAAKAQDAKQIDSAVDELSTITGQRPKVAYATKSISNFKLREGVTVGASVSIVEVPVWAPAGADAITVSVPDVVLDQPSLSITLSRTVIVPAPE
ncbi:hypothetical protein LCGC14_2297360 [marine sediment metagenome]|uniref:Large ribosomal subunit protein uL5 N-terminal domain-containing protein n=1 Tax=marine sediment metagenome TaxID=412755 RepID=A0A0F9DC53_9ZZZZ